MATSEFVCGTGAWVGPKPGDPDNNIVLNATSTFGGIDVSWSYPATNPHAVAHVVVYRGLTDNFGGAVQRTIVSGNHFFDKFDGDEPVVYYYWIQLVSVNGTYASFVGPASATARPSIEETIRQLSGKIDQGALAQELRADIDHIGLLDSTITGEIQNRIAANQAISLALGSVQDDVAAAITLIEEEVTERINANSALLTSLNLMGVGFKNAVAGLTEEIELIATDTSALATKITTVEATVNGNTATGQVGLTAKVNEITGAIQSMYTAKVGVNGLIGGFGLYNDGTSVEAGFDVDTFWVGKADKTIKPFIIENGEVFINKAAIQTLSASQIDTRGLSIRDMDGNIIFSAGNPLDWETGVGGSGKPQSGATRNVFRGDWSAGTAYDIGDVVIDTTGNGWSALKSHIAGATNKPPSYPEFSSNIYWTIYAIKGEDAVVGRLTNGNATISAASDGEVSPGSFVNASGTFELHRGVVRIPPSEVVFTVAESVGCAGTINAQGDYAVTAMSADDGYLLFRAKVGETTYEQKLTLSKSKAGTVGASAHSYWVNCYPKVISRDAAGKYASPQIEISAVTQIGSDTPVPYVGRFIVETTIDGSNFTIDYFSLQDESSIAFTLPNGIKSVRVRLYEDGLTDLTEFVTMLDEQSVAIVEDGVEYVVKIESSNGNVFKRGEARRTVLSARVFRNGVEVTDEIPTSGFKWFRQSMDPQPAPYDDSTWNYNHSSGFKSVEVSVDDVLARATFTCDITY